MSETPLAEKKINNDSGLLTGTYAYSPKLSFPQEYPIKPETSQSDSIEKILSTSIQRAKQKITMLQGRSKQERMDSKQRAVSREGQTSTTNAVAAAMKVLQSRVGELQRSIEGHQRQRAIIMKEIDNLSSEKKIILTNLEEANRKVALLQLNSKHSKAEIKELTKQLESTLSEKGQLYAKCQSLEMTVRHLETDKHQMSMSISRKEQESKQSPSHKQIIIKAAEIQEKQKMLTEKEKKIHERQNRLLQIQNILKEKQNRISNQSLKTAELSRQNQRLIKETMSLKKQRKGEQKNELQQKQIYEVYLKKISEMENELQMLRETTKDLTDPQQNNREEGLDVLRQDLKQFQGKYDELLHLYRRSEDKCKRQDIEVKICKSRIRQVQDMLSQILQKLVKLPNSTKDLKYLQVKASKILSSNIERISTLRTPTKSRSNSLNRSISKSSSQRKNMNPLDSSRNCKKSGSGSKSKKKEDSGSKSKRVVVSQGGWQSLEKQVVQLKKQYKKLVKMVNQTENEQIRTKLNELVFEIHDKGEQITKMKQNNRHK